MLSQMAEQVERGRISPMQIIQEQEEWIFNSDGGQKHPYRFIEPQAGLLWWERVTGCQLTQAQRDLWQNRRQDGGDGIGLGAEVRKGSRADGGADGPQKG